MPWNLVHNHPACRSGEWAVVNMQAEEEGRHSIEGCHPTKERALAQQRALYANEPSAGRQAIREVEQMDIQRLVLPISSKAVVDVGAGEITGLAAAYGNVDYQDDMFEPGAFAKSAEDWNRAKSRLPLLDWHGDSIDRIIGSVTQLKSVTQGLWFRAGFTKDERGQRARQLARDGYLTGVSVGWLPVHPPQIKAINGKAVQVIGEARVHEISLTPIPANEKAQLASVKSLDLGIKTVIGVHHTSTVDTPWDAGEVERNLPDGNQQGWRSVFAWYDSTAADDDGDGLPDAKSAWKFPHHTRAGGPANLGGVRNGLARLGQGPSIPPGDVAGVRAHLEAHLRDGGGTPGSQSSLAYELWAPELRKALEISHPPAQKAAVLALLDAYHPDDGAAGLADGQPTAPAAATTSPELEQGPADGTADPEPSSTVTAEQYALAVANPGPRDDAPAGEPQHALAYSQQMLEDMRTRADLDQLEAEIDRALGRAP